MLNVNCYALLSCVGLWFSCFQKLLNYLTVKYFGFKRTGWMLCQKPVVCTKFNVCVFITVHNHWMVSLTHVNIISFIELSIVCISIDCEHFNMTNCFTYVDLVYTLYISCLFLQASPTEVYTRSCQTPTKVSRLLMWMVWANKARRMSPVEVWLSQLSTIFQLCRACSFIGESKRSKPRKSPELTYLRPGVEITGVSCRPGRKSLEKTTDYRPGRILPDLPPSWPETTELVIIYQSNSLTWTEITGVNIWPGPISPD